MTTKNETKPRSSLEAVTADRIRISLEQARKDAQFKSRIRQWMSANSGLLIYKFDEYFERTILDPEHGPERAQADSMGIYLAGLVTRNAVEEGMIGIEQVQDYQRLQLTDKRLTPSPVLTAEQLASIFGEPAADALADIRNDYSRTACAFGLRVSFSELPSPFKAETA